MGGKLREGESVIFQWRTENKLLRNTFIIIILTYWSSFFKLEYPSGFDGSLIYMIDTGFPKKDARFSKIKNIPDLLSDDKEGKIM